jgi:hypothetical protein
VENLLLVFHFSISPRRRSCGNVGISPACGEISKGSWKEWEACFWLSILPQPGISTTLRWIRSQRTARQEGEIRHHGIEYCDRFFLLDPPLARAVAN